MSKFTNRADLLIAAGESIKMQEKAGISPCYKQAGNLHHFDFTMWMLTCRPETHEFPLAVVEGKAVFVGDELYAESGVKHVAPTTNEGKPMIFPVDHKWSWNPPKPATIMVELSREDAEYWASYDIEYAHIGCAPSKYKTASENFYKSVRKALEKK